MSWNSQEYRLGELVWKTGLVFFFQKIRHSPWVVESGGGRLVAFVLIGRLVPISSKTRRHLQGRLVPHAVPGQGSGLPNPGLASHGSNNLRLHFSSRGTRATPPSVVVPFPSSPPSTLQQTAPGSCCRPAQRFPPASPSPWERNTRTKVFCIFPCFARSLARATVSRLNHAQMAANATTSPLATIKLGAVSVAPQLEYVVDYVSNASAWSILATLVALAVVYDQCMCWPAASSVPAAPSSTPGGLG